MVMTAGSTRRRKTSLVTTKADLLQGRHVIDITDERLAAQRRDDFQRSLGPLSAIHAQGEEQKSGSFGRLRRLFRGGGQHG